MPTCYSAIAALSLLVLTGCQYVSFLKTNTKEYAHNYGNSPEVTCSALGAMRGDSSFDWCVAQEEADRRRRDQSITLYDTDIVSNTTPNDIVDDLYKKVY